ncbi:hypothetical protein J2X11_001666 [Aeromicrobium panaciterrae]|uniref:Uncharacterized protein n=1 Tax=Aeromicrobium panaciterrae TaxID=363861 RepID=A0ABU1UNT2_9ACTN|nr:hypothetical protein [Aeromicrobium panaciterrae]
MGVLSGSRGSKEFMEILTGSESFSSDIAHPDV